VPALPLSLINPALEQFQELPAGDRALLASACPSLLEYLARVPDPRDPRGVRHTLTSLLVTAVAAVLAGARSFAAVGEWVADAPPQVLASLGIRRDPLARRFEPPDEATIRRVLEAVDAAALDAAVGSWLGARLRAAEQEQDHGRRVRRALAVDGKAVRGTRHARRRAGGAPAGRSRSAGQRGARPGQRGRQDQTRSPSSRPCWNPWTWPSA
jgi:DDE_Tnp_1-associated